MGKIEVWFAILDSIFAIVGFILVVFGWIIPYRHSKKSEKIRQKYDQEIERNRWQKDFIDQQISKLYGPIYALILESDIQFSRVLYQIGRKTIFKAGQELSDLPVGEQEIWKHYVDTYKLKSQMKMVEIFRNNIHLVYKSEIPESYKTFLDYSLGWELLDNQKRNGVLNYYDYHYVHNYPAEFNRYIKMTLKFLQQRQYELLMLENKKYPSTAY